MASQNQWAYDLETLVYSVIKARSENALKTKYPKIKFTQEEQTDTTATFPTVLIQSLEPIEKNPDLEMRRINTVLYTAQVTVTTNTSRSDATKIAQEISEQFKKISFEVTPLPFTRKNGKLWTSILRARRSFDWNDKL